MRPELQSAVIAVLEESLAVNTKEVFRSLDGDPSIGFGHGAGKRVLTLRIVGQYRVNLFKETFISFLFP